MDTISLLGLSSRLLRVYALIAPRLGTIPFNETRPPADPLVYQMTEKVPSRLPFL
jgi:hypothetical protein